MAQVVVALILAEKGILPSDPAVRPSRLLSVGSVLHFASEGDTIWGSGVNAKIDATEHRYQQLDVRAVRGPLTRRFLAERKIAVPEIYGDPALLIPELIKGRVQRRSHYKIGLVPNLNDIKNGNVPPYSDDIHVISPFLPWIACIREIAACDFVIASSLHGLILADAYGIPNRMVRYSEIEPPFKYDDYYLGTGRSPSRPARSVEEALELGSTEPLGNFDTGPLRASFPYDLWA